MLSLKLRTSGSISKQFVTVALDRTGRADMTKIKALIYFLLRLVRRGAPLRKPVYLKF
jgi:hypothetical protein